MAARSSPFSVAIFRADGAAGIAGRGRGFTSSGPAAIGLVVSVFWSGRPAGTGAAWPSAGLVAPSPAAIEPRRAPTPTVAPSLAAIASITPADGAGTSRVTLSVSSSTSGSSTATTSPTFLNQRPMVASVTDSPRVGTLISVAMIVSCRLDLLGERLVEEGVELGEVF